MAQTESYQDLVLGSGAGGKLLAWHLARSERRVVVVERRWVGGCCPDNARLPAHLLVLGGGYVSLELAQAYRRFGSRVTVVEHGSQLAGREDPDVADALGRLFGDEGIDMLLAAEALQVEGRSGHGVRLRVRTLHGERRLDGSDLLVATGRTPHT